MSNFQEDKTIEIKIKDNDDIEKPDEQKPENGSNQSVAEQSHKDAPSEKDFPNYYELYLRSQAEFQNYKKRSEQRMQEWRHYAAKDIVTQLLPVIDDFDILFDHNKQNSDTVSFDGVKMIYQKLLSSLKELGLEPIEAMGKMFDPNIHEAVLAEETDQIEEGHVVRVWQQGFMFKDSLLRPAKVIIAKAKQDGVNDGEQ